MRAEQSTILGEILFKNASVGWAKTKRMNDGTVGLISLRLLGHQVVDEDSFCLPERWWR